MNYYCPVCGGQSSHSSIFKKNNYSIVRCEECQMVHIEPMPTPEQARDFYKMNGLASYTEDYLKSKLHDETIEYRFKRYLSILLKYACNGDNILDIGCHDGAFLRLLKNAGFDAYGQEVQIQLADMVKQKLGIAVYKDDLVVADIQKRFNFISALSVIEHAPNIEQLVKKVNTLLVPGGYFLIEVPNVDSFESKLIHYFFGQTLGYWFEPTPPIHLWEFNKQTIQMFLDRHDFETVEINTFSPFDSAEDIAKYPEGYYIAREGLDAVTLANEQRAALNALREEGNTDGNYEKMMIYIAKKLVRTVFEECKPFEEVADNKSVIWIMARKKK